ncbi:hypothetical protein NPA31_010635 [Aurantimonas sp. MSK8Z-1]|uniref:hypothetical protein n=1 Tax=Mangrovibrevibacter kandeliae TaxID=2968473 RepID=UPI002117A48F|nr:hypothetical protein [Aurantimonas sp. MSK8Z-1]MCW4115415.1 hypothetical protein [Aurantimonas sp. MSK8Z-1]
MAEARHAKRTVQAQLQGRPGVSLGIGQSENGNDYAVLVLVEDEQTANNLPLLTADIPVKIAVTGKVAVY